MGTSDKVEDKPNEMEVDTENASEPIKNASETSSDLEENSKPHDTEEDNNDEKMEVEQEMESQPPTKDTGDSSIDEKQTEKECSQEEASSEEVASSELNAKNSENDSLKASSSDSETPNDEEKGKMDIESEEVGPTESDPIEKGDDHKQDDNEPQKDKEENDSLEATESKVEEQRTPVKDQDSNQTKEELKSEEDKEKIEISSNEMTKKPILKLASFADMSSKAVISPSKEKKVCQSYKATGCSQCFRKIQYTINATVWETMQFCDEKCLAGYQGKMNKCSTCKKLVNVGSLGKYCVRFGSDVKQFCSNVCLEDHKKGLKVCCYCQKNITKGDGFMAPIGGKGQFKDFCAQKCLQKYQELHGTKKVEKEIAKCAVCSKEKTVDVKLILLPSHGKNESEKVEEEEHEFKKNECAQDANMAFDLPLESPEKSKSEVKEETPNKKEEDKSKVKEEKLTPKKEVAEYDEYNGLMVVKLCSQACLSAYKFTHSAREGCITEPCDQCKTPFQRLEEERENAEEWLKDYSKNVHVIFYKGMSKRFCSSACQNVYVMQNREIVPCMNCKVRKYNFDMIEKYRKPANLPLNAPIPSTSTASYFCSTNCLKVATASQPSVQQPPMASGQTQTDTIKHGTKSQAVSTATETNRKQVASPPPPPQIQIHTQTVTNTVKETMVKLPEAKEMKNKAIMTKPFMMTKGVSCRPHPCHKQSQTDFPSQPALVPVPVPTYMPVPLKMYSKPYPVPIPVPLPIPVPVFVPTTRNSYKGILKQIRKIRAKMPSDPFEAEMLALAGGVDHDAGEESDDSLPDTSVLALEDDESRNKRKSKALLELPAPSQDLENDIKAGKVVPKPLPKISTNTFESDWEKRRQTAVANANARGSKQGRDTPSKKQYGTAADSKHHLKFTYGVNAFKNWVAAKNAELEKERSKGKYTKPFESDLSKLRADELNYTLCLFVKDVKKPNGENYAADSVLYLCYGIQEYLLEKGKTDNIFGDQYYEPFTTALHEMVKDFKLPKNELGYFVTRIEEEHLWEAKQLGAHSPQVLLNTLAYFNTKYFVLRSVEDHQKLSYTQVMKHWKKGEKEADKLAILRYNAPAKKGNRTDERKIYEQQENTENPLRCPVKLYEFYLSKCPEPSKIRSDVFYLLPERSCMPDSNIWYSNTSLPVQSIDKMVNRALMVREVQEHMLTDH